MFKLSYEIFIFRLRIFPFVSLIVIFWSCTLLFCHAIWFNCNKQQAGSSYQYLLSYLVISYHIYHFRYIYVVIDVLTFHCIGLHLIKYVILSSISCISNIALSYRCTNDIYYVQSVSLLLLASLEFLKLYRYFCKLYFINVDNSWSV